MIERSLMVLAGLVAGAFCLDAGAASARVATPSLHEMNRQQDEQIRLAQAREVGIYYDEYGRRLVVDMSTGEVIGIERPQRTDDMRDLRRRLRESGLLGADDFRQDPEALERYRKHREYQLGLREPPEDRRYLDEDYYRRGDPHDAPYEQAPEFADPPREWDGSDPYARPRVARRDPVERRPLAPPSAGRPSDEGPDGGTVEAGRLASEDVARLQVVLDRAGVSPGVIDGRMGSNVEKALTAYVELTGQSLRADDHEAVARALEASGRSAFTTYAVTPEDAAGPYVASIPSDYGEKAKLQRLGFTSASEKIAERFHMDESYLVALNPGARFRPGEQLKVVDPGKPGTGSVSHIVADKSRKQVRAYDAAGGLVAAYPATIGSSDTPSPTGTHEVARVAFDPEYTYNPRLNFKQGSNDRVLTIPPGPNGPVGSIWIALSKPTYGIHGTPEPSRIGKTNSHGCVRLTNWDAQELARMVKPGVTVEFLE
ncbi:L,D-transpeptidase family protein [Mesorhizobium xinjiangense]|uniref:L,D-transpeptidase family protein n=1 Tax=Mesorhizobium xinjiangense TaxID=2678685 RepID=UPI0018DD24AE|nr:L,D-transpeptidase [Mesorhizobium xinjiangense]